MTITGLDSIDRTLQKTNQWLTGIMDSMGTNDHQKAYAALRAVIHVLRDRLPIAAVAGLGAQLPMLVRGIYYDGWQPHPDGNLRHLRTVAEFFTAVRKGLPPRSDADPEGAVRAVLGVMREHLDPNEVAKVVHHLPRQLHELWTDPVEPRDT